MGVMSEFDKRLAALLSRQCKKCGGSGKVNDAEPGDICYREWGCTECSGTGINASAGGECPDDCKFKDVPHRHVEGIVGGS